MATSVCRVCLVVNTRMLNIDDIHLQETYEKLTDTKLHPGRENGMPSTVCYVCHRQLQRCHRFSHLANNSNRILQDLLQNSTELTQNMVTMLYQRMHNIPVTLTDNIPNISSDTESSAETSKQKHIVIKEETNGSDEIDIEEKKMKKPSEIDVVEIKLEKSNEIDEEEMKLQKPHEIYIEEIKLEKSSEIDEEEMNMEFSEENVDDGTENEQSIDLTSPKAQNANENLIPEKSKEKYLATYANFLQWQTNKKTQSFSEKVFLAYFYELANTYKPSSLWCIYSMLRSMVKLKHRIDIKTYCDLMAFLKTRSDGYIGRKSKVLSPADVEKFLNEAPDNQYLATKVALIFGVTGACKRQELYNITTKDVETRGNTVRVKITQARTKSTRSFTIQGTYREIVKKYQDLRSTKTTNDRFFQNFQKGKCTAQTIGINKFGTMPKDIAKYLGLPEADLYTGHSFRRTSATMLADSGIDI